MQSGICQVKMGQTFSARRALARPENAAGIRDPGILLWGGEVVGRGVGEGRVLHSPAYKEPILSCGLR